MENNPKILIVEDSLIVALHLQSTLESENYLVVGKCTSGEEALAFIEHTKPDLVLMDVMLSGEMDGVEATRQIKAKYDLPVIYITALTDKETIQRAKVTEPYGYLTKPFEDRVIFTVIEMALYKHSIQLKLKESEEKYFSTVKSISDAVVVINEDYKITYINPTASALLQCTLADAQGKFLTDVLRITNADTGETRINPIQCEIGKLNKSAMPDNFLLTSKYGRTFPIGESSLSLLLDSADKFRGLILIFRDLTEKKEHERIVKELEKHRLAALIEGQEKERSRIAKDLHDGLGQILNAIKMNVHAIVGDERKASELNKLLDEAIQESVRISENLLPSKLKDFDLATCLRSLCKNMNQTGKVPIRFETIGSDVALDQSRKVNLYRIAQEALTNAIRHSHATEILVRLEGASKTVRLRIEDNGEGISRVQDERSHNGLINMKDRTEVLEGNISIVSTPNQGTRVVVDAPILLQ